MDALLWLMIFIVLTVLEVITLGLVTIWFAGGAIVAFVVAICGGTWQLQLILFALVSMVLLIFTRPLLKDFINRKTTRTNVDSLIGQLAVVTVEIDNLTASGAATINGLEWTARSAISEVKIPAGMKVRIVEVSGVKLIVEPAMEEPEWEGN